MKPNRGSDRIRMLNDSFRQTFIGGRVVKTDGVAAQNEAVQQNLVSKVKSFGKFEPGNDPYGEHDFGSVELGGTTFFWKIDLYEEQNVNRPTEVPIVTRVLTIMLSEEY